MTSFHRARLERKALKDKKVLWYVVFTGRSALSDIKHDATGKCFRSDQARTASVLNSLKTPSCEFIGEVILKINVV
jgi:hypothetical protein